MRNAFTMIELIFVVVIIGILVSIALPKMLSVRDDAKESVLATNIRMCIADAASEYQSVYALTDLNHLLSCVKANAEESGVVTLSGDNVIVNSSNSVVNGIIANGSYPVKGYQVSR